MEFETFPLRKGFLLIPQDDYKEWPKYILNPDRSRLSPETLAQVLQAWLFFGLMIEVLKVSGVSVNVQDFIQREGSDTYVTTTALPKYLSEWEQKELSCSRTDRKAHFQRQQHMIMISTYFRLHQLSGERWEEELLFWVERSKESYTVALPLAIDMSITILSETLDRASRRAFGNLDRSSADTTLHNKSLMDQLKAWAWCPSEISLILEGLDDTSGFYVSQVDRQRLRADHSKCSSNKCLAFNIVTEQYETKHTFDCPGYQFLDVDRQQLAATIRRGRTPRACLQFAASCHAAPIKITVDESGPYVAISHVWSDGLGNSNANSLPTCQLLRLHRLALALNVGFAEGTSAIWIDSLLVPVKKGNEKRLALSLLCDYYQAADKVLVLDSDLLQASIASTNEELITRIFFSTWMRRLWTLEEGILSRTNLEFQFRDGTFSMSNFSDPHQFSKSFTGIGEVITRNMRKLLPNLANYYQRSPENSQSRRPVIAELLPALEYRLTTKAVDEPLCLAHILGLDASRLVVIDDAHLRMKRLLQLLAEHQALFPMRFLFTKEPKLQLEGFRWAPTSFMALDHEDVTYLLDHSDSPYTRSTDKGLQIKGLAGFTLRFGSETFKKVMYAEADMRVYALTPVPVGKSCRKTERFWTPESLNEALKIDPTQCWNPEMQALLSTSPETTAVLCDNSFGLLVSIYDSVGRPSDPDGSLLYVRPIGQVYKRELKTASQNFFATGADSDMLKQLQPDFSEAEIGKQMRDALDKVHDSKTSTFLRCKAIDPSQRWCVG